MYITVLILKIRETNKFEQKHISSSMFKILP